MLTGEFTVTLDDAGRINLPRRLRDILEQDKVVLTKGSESCLWLYSAGEWKEMLKTVVDATNPFSARNRDIRRRFIGPAHELDIDKQGRIPVAPMLREWAGLSRDCVVLGQYDYVEIWAEDRYRAYMEASEDEFRAGSEELGARIMKERDLGKDGDSSYSGVTGGDNTVSRPEGQV